MIGWMFPFELCPAKRLYCVYQELDLLCNTSREMDGMYPTTA